MSEAFEIIIRCLASSAVMHHAQACFHFSTGSLPLIPSCQSFTAPIESGLARGEKLQCSVHKPLVLSVTKQPQNFVKNYLKTLKEES